MADNMEPPPLFENVNINKNDDSESDLFESAIQVPVHNYSPKLEQLVSACIIFLLLLLATLVNLQLSRE